MHKVMRHTDLCSGIGGFSLGFQQAGLSQPVLFCDTDAWCRKVLGKHWPDVPIAEDVKELASDPARLVPDCDILTAGYPCQPFSVAGKQRGKEDDRHIWPEIFAIIEAKRPRWIVCENVVGHISLGLDKVLSDLADKAGYEVQTFCVGAVAVDAPHRRQRVWIVAHADSESEPDGTRYAEAGKRLVGHAQNDRRDGRATQIRRQGQTHQSDQPGLGVRSEPSRPSENVADTQSQRIQGHRAGGEQVAHAHERQTLSLCRGQRPRETNWPTEPPVGRVANGIPRRVDRLKGLGNAIVPAIAQRIAETIKAVEHG